ncbi:MAG: aminotransferase class V-fold PLP-dependent enzyme, partial [Rhodospirillales bacterium]
MSFDVAAVRTLFPAFADPAAASIADRPLHYLDNAAISQLARPAMDAVAGFEMGGRANVRRGVHRLAERATEAY